MNQETFSSRWGLVVAGLGVALGTGNLWRFPRIAAQNGGAAFLIPWFIFLLIWSLPLLIAEFGLGRASRRGVVGTFANLVGKRYAWMGGFVGLTSVMILFYYSVVTGWTLKYCLAAVTGELVGVDSEAYWRTYNASIWQPIFFHLMAVSIGGFIIYRGVVKGIERANKILVPILFFILIVAVIRAVTLPGATRGLEFLFSPDLSVLTNYRTWLEALTQSAWSTGAGWGLILTYAIYMKRDEDVVVNAATIAFGNNSVSLLAAMAVLPTVFAVLSTTEASNAMESGNLGLTFIWIPQLFLKIPGGFGLLQLFFLGLFCAALSSLIAMLELATRLVVDAGIRRKQAIIIVCVVTGVCGIPSAVSLEVFTNQDWVWGIALMINGLFISLAVTKYGQRRFRDELINVKGNDLSIGRIYEWILKYLVPVEAGVILLWWMYQAATVYDPIGWWNPLRTYSVGTCLVQWGIGLFVLLLFNKQLASVSTRTVIEENV